MTAGAAATGAAGADARRRPSDSARLVSVLLTVVAVIYVLLPGLQGAAVPQASAELGIGPPKAGVGQVLSGLVVLGGLFAAGPAGEWTHRLGDDIAVIALSRTPSGRPA